ncbi:helix-turn-helix domain-containing protein [Sphingomonas immobilis]|uniref:Helix-turn-helix domain-containing protein n=1 Tax=Sphingomonas immobilis TaxID=3063997 RepID=A0ABT8ZW01_9SPHN|nr:helix-turn-helix domain-containing protein [Sphingomonas sp. CA1-15]MDO7841748.1 helix-turn-helix domain-containing protein [Sphingomonas sp. CA1-15]
MLKGIPMTHLARSSKQLGTLIHNARVHRALTQQALADLVGTGQKTISRIEGGQLGTKLETLFGILAALDLDMRIGPRDKGGADIGEIF